MPRHELQCPGEATFVVRTGKESMRNYKYLFLTLMLVTALILESLARRTALGAVAADLFLTILAMAVFAVVFQRRWERIVALFTAAAPIAITW